ncbi:uncharacterized protein [Ptychodera flava]|uniref:uncharacterized protein n=1 Tax=Ptychodera flava TaxID=63121 RepID=UPI003969C63E
MQTNARQRRYKNGKALSEEICKVIVDDLQRLGANSANGVVPRGSLKQVGEKYRLSDSGVRKIWWRYCTTGDYTAKQRRVNQRALLHQDIAFLEVMKRQRPSATYGEMRDELSLVSPTQLTVRTISNYVRKHFSGGEWTRKKITRVATERLTEDNLMYTQAFMDLLHEVEPHRLKFMDESGFKTPNVGNPKYGTSPRGDRCVEVIRYHQRSNSTLNLLVGLNGVVHSQVIDGTSDSATFTNFIEQCVNTVSQDGYPALQVGDYLVIDNAPFHHSDMAMALAEWLNIQGIEYIFTPKYSPEFNPAEFCFSKIKHSLLAPDRRTLVYENMAFAIHDAIHYITPADTAGYFQATGYIRNL